MTMNGMMGKAMLISLTKACKLKNDQVKTRLPIHLGIA